MLKVSHAKPLHDATALMADEARMRNRQSVHMARMRCGARVCCPFTMVVGRERLCATETIPPVVARILLGDSTSPLTREASVVVRSEG